MNAMRSVSHFFYDASYSQTTWRYCSLELRVVGAQLQRNNQSNKKDTYCIPEQIYKSLTCCPTVCASILAPGDAELLLGLLFHLTHVRSIDLSISAYLVNDKKFDHNELFNRLKQCTSLEKLVIRIDRYSYGPNYGSLETDGEYLAKLIDALATLPLKEFECQANALSWTDLECIVLAFPNLTCLKLSESGRIESKQKQLDIPRLLQKLPELQKVQLHLGLQDRLWFAKVIRKLLPIPLMQQITELDLADCTRFNETNYQTLNTMIALTTLRLKFHARFGEHYQRFNSCVKTLSQHPTIMCLDLLLTGTIYLHSGHIKHIAKMKKLKTFQLVRRPIYSSYSTGGKLLYSLQQIKSLTLNGSATVESIVELLNTLQNLENLTYLINDDMFSNNSSLASDLDQFFAEQVVSNTRYKNLKYLQVGDIYRRCF